MSSSARARSTPHSDAALPDVRPSPVSGFNWKIAPLANEPGNSPEKKRSRKWRWASAFHPTEKASASVMSDLVIGKSVDEALAIHQQFVELMQGRGNVVPDEDVLEDGVAFAGVAKFPARVKCALLAWMAWKDATAQVLETEETR